MTASELIEELQQYAPDAVVFFPFTLYRQVLCNTKKKYDDPTTVQPGSHDEESPGRYEERPQPELIPAAFGRVGGHDG